MSPPHLCWPKRYAMSPPDPCFPTNVCKVATWPYLKIVETGLGFIYLWSINFWMSSWKKTDTNNTMDFFWIITRSSIHVYAMSPWTTHNYKHICNVAPWTLRCKKCMQGRHFSFFKWKVICNVAMWPPSSQSIIIRSHYDAIVILGLRWIASSFVCSVAMRYLLSIELCMQCRHVGGPRSDMQCRHAIRFANSTLYAMSPPHPFTVMHICNVAA